MTNPTLRERLLEVLRRASETAPVPETGHVVEDEELLACWSADLITAQERQRLLDHLSICPKCRKEVAAMLRDGRLDLPEVRGGMDETTAAAEDRPAISTETPRYSERRRSFGVVNLVRWTVAASLLIAIAGVWWYGSSANPARMLALADRELRAGQAVQAMRRVEPLLSKQLTPELAEKARGLMEEAGYQAAEAELLQEDFKGVLEIEDRVADRAGSSGRLANLRLQAERGISHPLALAKAGSLTDYGYDLDGSSLHKAFALMDPTAERLSREYEAAIAKHPNDSGLLLNFGQFLLQQGRFEQASEQFRVVRKLDGDNVLAKLGFGLAEFQQRHYDAALTQFESAAKMQPENAATQLNMGACLALLNRKAEAKACWQRALALTKDPQLQRQIRNQLEQVEGNH